MQFNDYFTHYQLAKSSARQDRVLQNLSAQEFARGYITQLESICRASYGKQLVQVDPFTPTLIQLEADWHDAGRPYYNLWPSIITSLTKLRMDADASFFRLPLDQLLIRFPKQDNPLAWTDKGQEWSVRAVLCNNAQLLEGKRAMRWIEPRIAADLPSKRGIAFWIDVNEPLDHDLASGHPGRLHRMMYKHIVCDEGKSIEWSFDNIPAHDSADIGVQYPDHIVRDVARIVCTLCLMAEDKEIVEPIVLKADEDKFDRTGDLALVAKAIRRGNYGFNVGRSIEVVPHVRSACPAALYWTGEGRKIPKIRFRRGTVVHRKRLAQVPTGFLDKEKTE